ncbi:hypothetical protein FO440_08475 [Mucilaginibacter corticis]|uniref:Uncharacterized protein n=1 Tax=Mucilaginibacter corticis TaxID=2597670 RepID=A0A556MWF1_9SPHI|nr:hypothetical protein [Mucilaginibacter corticis]TSJ44193.1 hypothetical protein FO440_08475 [Mucilaginibacter corticis]
MDMQDKEFDEIFSSKFEDFEAEPSPMVWNNIADELDGKKSTRTVLPWLSIAATIVVLLTAGALFLRKDKPTTGDNKPSKLVATHIKPAISKEDNQNAGPVDQAKPSDKIAVAANHQHKNSLPVHKVIEPVTDKENNQDNEVQQSKPDDQRLIAAIPDASIANTKPVLPDVKLNPKATGISAQAVTERPIVMASAGNEESEPAKKHGIRSLGGLINVLIAKVDKRQDKLIEFSDSDDDDTESNVTGVNLGVIKIKKQ